MRRSPAKTGEVEAPVTRGSALDLDLAGSFPTSQGLSGYTQFFGGSTDTDRHVMKCFAGVAGAATPRPRDIMRYAGR
jgi:hypothetical protein